MKRMNRMILPGGWWRRTATVTLGWIAVVQGWMIGKGPGPAPAPASLLSSWTCVGIHRHMDETVPHRVQVGDMPLVLWRDPGTDTWLSTVNVCKHMGSRLDLGKITAQGRIKCPYHGLEFGAEDQFGQVMVHEGKLFWSHDPSEPAPPRIPFYHHKDYVTSHLQLDMDASLTDCAYNSMDVHHPEFVHRMGFGSSIPPTNLRHYRYTNRDRQLHRVGLAFDYQSNAFMQMLNQNHDVTHNFHMYLYPSFTWSRVSFQKNHLIVALNLCPLTPDKTRWYVTLCHNYYRSSLGQEMMKMLALTIMSQDYTQLNLQAAEGPIKHATTFRRVLDKEDSVWWVREMMKQYQYPDIHVCEQALRRHYRDRAEP